MSEIFRHFAVTLPVVACNNLGGGGAQWRMGMLGAIIGDICGAGWDAVRAHSDRFTMFTERSRFTDATVCTVAVAEAVMSDRDFSGQLRGWCRRYPHLEYGGRFKAWFLSENAAYGSYGNGGAMRVSAVALLSTTLDEAASLARRSAAVTHDHPEGMRGADVIATLSWMALHGHSPEDLMRSARAAGYMPERPAGVVTATDALTTVPAAVWSAISGRDFQHAIELAASCSGAESNSICAMAGSIAEHLHGIPDALVRRASNFLDPPLLDVVFRTYRTAAQRGNLHLRSVRTTASGLRGAPAGPMTELAQLIRRAAGRWRQSAEA